MSGYNSKFLYDQCVYDQNLKLSIEPGNYNFVLDKYENDNIGISKILCQSFNSDLSESNNNKSRCQPILLNDNANIEAKYESIGERTDIENSLLAIDRPTTKCLFKQYHNCDLSDDIAKKYVLDKSESTNCVGELYKKYCNKNLVLVNTKLGDRYIVPTNNKMPIFSGF